MNIHNNKEFGEIVRKTRLKQKLRKVDLARKASVRQALTSDLENGVTSARLDTVSSHAYGVQRHDVTGT